MKGRTLYKEGVMGVLTREARRGQGRLARAYHDAGFDFIITSVREGTHGAGSLHPLGLAFDYDPQGFPFDHDKEVLGKDWDVIDERDHRHAELDPK